MHLSDEILYNNILPWTWKEIEAAHSQLAIYNIKPLTFARFIKELGECDPDFDIYHHSLDTLLIMFLNKYPTYRLKQFKHTKKLRSVRG